MNPQTRETQSTITPAKALELLKEGNQRFLANQMQDHHLLQQVEITSQGQHPFAVVLGCIDSRVPPELIFDQGVGDIFGIRIAGNFVNQDILGSMEYGCKLAGAKQIIVLGHSRCGAIGGVYRDVQLGNLTAMLNKLKPAVAAAQRTVNGNELDDREMIECIARENVKLTIEEIKQGSPVLNELCEKGELGITGAMYDVQSGRVTFLS